MKLNLISLEAYPGRQRAVFQELIPLDGTYRIPALVVIDGTRLPDGIKAEIGKPYTITITREEEE